MENDPVKSARHIGGIEIETKQAFIQMRPLYCQILEKMINARKNVSGFFGKTSSVNVKIKKEECCTHTTQIGEHLSTFGTFNTATLLLPR